MSWPNPVGPPPSRRRLRARLFAAAVAGAALTAALPAAAQFSSARSALPDLPRLEPVQFRDFFPFWGGRGSTNSYNPSYGTRQPQVFESVRAPPPRKTETPPTSTILVVGDTLADWLGYGLEEAFADTPDVGIVRKIRPSSGLVRYDWHPDAPEWSQAVKDVLAAEKPRAIVIMLGLNDRLPLRERPAPAKAAADAAAPGEKGSAPASAEAPNEQRTKAAPEPAPRRSPVQVYEFHTDKWAEFYAKRIDDMIAALKSKGVPVVWVGLPAVRGARATSDMSYLDELYRARAEKAGITYVDIWDGFVDDKGNFTYQGPDFEGQIRRLRTYDGVHFTKAGAEKLARYVERELRRLLTTRVVPVALPSPEQKPSGGGRPAIGPVLPLSTTVSGEQGGLLGASNHPIPPPTDPLVTRVLSRGDAITAPADRGDNFSWPRRDTGTAVETAPAAPPAKGANKGEANKNDAGKNDLKKPLSAHPRVAPAPPGAPRAALDGAPPRPPLPLTPSRD